MNSISRTPRPLRLRGLLAVVAVGRLARTRVTAARAARRSPLVLAEQALGRVAWTAGYVVGRLEAARRR